MASREFWEDDFDVYHFESDESEFGPYDVDVADLEEPGYIQAVSASWSPDAVSSNEPDEGEEFESIKESARHPYLPSQIMYGENIYPQKQAWIRDTDTKKTIWRPEGATHMAWLRAGAEIGIIAETFTLDPNRPAIIGSRLQSEMSYRFERWTWPDRQRISSCPITMRTGWPTQLLPTPDPHLVMFEWYDQGEAGYEGIRLNDQ